jgi:hypothetical protein
LITVFLFAFYLVFFYIVFRTYRVGAHAGFSPTLWYVVVLLKFGAGCFNLYVHENWYITNDVFFYYTQSIEELEQGRNDPWGFIFTWLFDWEDMSSHLNFFKKEHMVYWSTLGTLFHTKLMTLCNILSLGREYLNVFFYNLIFFIGQFALYKTFYELKPQYKHLFLLGVFLIPSVLFWNSGIHKDGLVLSVLGVMIYAAHRLIQRLHWKYIILVMLSLFLLLSIRYFYFLCLLPALLLWLLLGNKKKPFLGYIVSYGLGLILFFTIHRFSSITPMDLVRNRQLEFFAYRGYSDLATPLLENSPSSYWQHLPTSLNHIFLQPYFSTSAPLKYQVAAFDNLFILLLLLLACMKIRKPGREFSIVWFVFFFAIPTLLFIGYTIPNCGALIRYRSTFVAMLVPAFFLISDLSGVERFISRFIPTRWNQVK